MSHNNPTPARVVLHWPHGVRVKTGPVDFPAVGYWPALPSVTDCPVCGTTESGRLYIDTAVFKCGGRAMRSDFKNPLNDWRLRDMWCEEPPIRSVLLTLLLRTRMMWFPNRARRAWSSDLQERFRIVIDRVAENFPEPKPDYAPALGDLRDTVFIGIVPAECVRTRDAVDFCPECGLHVLAGGNPCSSREYRCFARYDHGTATRGGSWCLTDGQEPCIAAPDTRVLEILLQRTMPDHVRSLIAEFLVHLKAEEALHAV